MRYIQWRRCLQLHVCVSILGHVALVHTACVLFPCNSIYGGKTARLSSGYANPSLQIISHLLLETLQRTLACRPSILPMFCRPSVTQPINSSSRFPKVNIREGDCIDLSSYPVLTIKFSWPGVFLNIEYSLLFDCLAISCMGCRYIVRRVIVGSYCAFFLGN